MFSDVCFLLFSSVREAAFSHQCKGEVGLDEEVAGSRSSRLACRSPGVPCFPLLALSGCPAVAVAPLGCLLFCLSASPSLSLSLRSRLGVASLSPRSINTGLLPEVTDVTPWDLCSAGLPPSASSHPRPSDWRPHDCIWLCLSSGLWRVTPSSKPGPSLRSCGV